MTEEDQLRAESAEIEHLLAEIRDLVPLPAWQRVERVVRRVVALYAAGLARTIDHARRSEADATFDERLAADDLVTSLLLLHGIHPLTPEDRLDRAIAKIHHELGLPARALVLVSFADGVVQLRADVSLGGGAMAERVAIAIVRKAIEAAVPEVTSLAVAGTTPVVAPSLVQLRVRREAP